MQFGRLACAALAALTFHCGIFGSSNDLIYAATFGDSPTLRRISAGVGNEYVASILAASNTATTIASLEKNGVLVIGLSFFDPVMAGIGRTEWPGRPPSRPRAHAQIASTKPLQLFGQARETTHSRR